MSNVRISFFMKFNGLVKSYWLCRIEMKDSTGLIEIKNVSFSYVPEKPLIQNLNLTVKPGQRIDRRYNVDI